MPCDHTKLLIAAILVLFSMSNVKKVASNASPALDAFFLELDNNHDGAIDVDEAFQFIGDSIGGQEFDEPQEAADAAKSFVHSLDGGDAGMTVSVDELDIHLHSVLSGVRVWEWIRHGVGLPQYAESFRAHSITPLDFPVIVQDNGKVLEEELGVSSPFHRSKVIRAIHRQILGLGQPSSEPQNVKCISAASTSPPTTPGGLVDGLASIQWSPPANPGVPPLHRYVLERAGTDGQWRQVAELDDPEPAAVVVTLKTQSGQPAPSFSIGPGVWEGATSEELASEREMTGELAPDTATQQVLYRVAAWNLYGRSTYGMAACQLGLVTLPGLPASAELNTTSGSVGEDVAVGYVAASASEQRVVGDLGEGPGSRCRDWSCTEPFSTADVMNPHPPERERSPICSPLGGGADGEVEAKQDVAALLLQRQQHQHRCPQQAKMSQAPLQQKTEVAAKDCGDGSGRFDLGDSDSSRSCVAEKGDAALTQSLPSRPPRQPPRQRPFGNMGPPQAQAAQNAQVQAQAMAQPTPQPRRWWSTLLLAVLPWLLRLLPVRVLRAVADCLSRLLLRVHSAVGWQPPAFLSSASHSEQPAPFLQPGTAAPLGHTFGYGVRAVREAGFGTSAGASDGVRGDGLSGCGDPNGSNPGAVEPRTLEVAYAGASAASVAPVLALRPRDNWHEAILPVAATEALLKGTDPVGLDLAPAVMMPFSYRNGQCRPQAAVQSPYGSYDSEISAQPYGNPRGLPGNYTGGGIEGSRCGYGTTPGGLPTSSVPTVPPGSPACLRPPYRSTSEGDVCGLEDAERSSLTARSNPFSQQHPGSPQLHSQHYQHNLAGSAPTLDQSLLSAAVGSRPGPASSTALGGGPRGAMRETGTEVDLLAMAAAASGSGSGGAGGVSGRGRGKVCAIAGCDRRLDLRHYRDYMRRHYCGRCQRTVCGQHTAYSPHGATGSCDHVSRCVCTSCFTHFNPAYQLFLLKHNRLQPVMEAQGPVDSMSGVQGVALIHGQREACASGSGSGGGTQRGSEATEEDKSAAKLLWERAATKLKAVTRFRKKGAEGQGRELPSLND